MFDTEREIDRVIAARDRNDLSEKEADELIDEIMSSHNAEVDRNTY